MLQSQSLQVKLSETRSALGTLLAMENRSEEQGKELEKATADLQRYEVEYRAAVADESAASTLELVTDQNGKPEHREFLEVRSKATVSSFLSAAFNDSKIDGASKEYSQALSLPTDGPMVELPLDLLADGMPQGAPIFGQTEKRADAITNVGSLDDTGAVNRNRWIDRIFGPTAARYLGVTFDTARVGEAAYLLTTAGPGFSLRSKGQVQDAGAFTFSATAVHPRRVAGRYVVNVEDLARLPNLEDAIRRDMAMALAKKLDNIILTGDTTPTTAADDIGGLDTAATSDTTMRQASNKLTLANVLDAFHGLVDGSHAISPSDIRVVMSTTASAQLYSTLQSNTARSDTQADALRNTGINWIVNDNFSAAIANNAFVALSSRARGLPGAYVAVTWPTMQLIRDPYTLASSGRVALTNNTLFGTAMIRAANFYRHTVGS